MFASGNKIRNTTTKPTAAPAAPKSAAFAGRQNARAARAGMSAPVNPNSNPNASNNTNTNNTNASTGADVNIAGVRLQQSPQLRSKFTERRLMPVVSTTPAVRLRNGRMDNNQGTSNTSGAGNNTVKNATVANKFCTVVRGAPANTASRAMTRQWRNKESAKSGNDGKVKANGDKLDSTQISEMGIQTNEQEILNHDLIIGDIKLILPSIALVNEIERQRQEIRKKTLLNTQRKFEEHSEKQEEHLTDLKEFLEKAVVTRRSRKPKITLEVDKKLIHSMDEILNKEMPKSESYTDIKGRIKKKEEELLTLFDTVENLRI